MLYFASITSEFEQNSWFMDILLIKHWNSVDKKIVHLECQWLVAPMENKHNCDTICIWVSLLNDIELHNTIIISSSLLYVAFIKGEKLFLNVMYKGFTVNSKGTRHLNLLTDCNTL